MLRKTLLQTAVLGLIFALGSLSLVSCAPTYDATADQMLVNTQKETDDGLIRLEDLGTEIQYLKSLKEPSPEDQKTLAEDEKQASYSSNIGFYSSLFFQAIQDVTTIQNRCPESELRLLRSTTQRRSRGSAFHPES